MNYENSTAVLDVVLLSKQAINSDLFFTRGRHNIIDIYYVPQSYFHVRKNVIRNNCKIFFLFIQNLTDIILIFHTKSGIRYEVTRIEKTMSFGLGK